MTWWQITLAVLAAAGLVAWLEHRANRDPLQGDAFRFVPMPEEDDDDGPAAA